MERRNLLRQYLVNLNNLNLKGRHSKNIYSHSGNREGNWMIGVSETRDGKTTRVSVPVRTERLVAMLEFIYLAYIKNH